MWQCCVFVEILTQCFFLYTEGGKGRGGQAFGVYCIVCLHLVLWENCGIQKSVCLASCIIWWQEFPWQTCHPLSNQPHGFMYHHYLLMFDMVHTPGVCNFLLAYLTYACLVLILCRWQGSLVWSEIHRNVLMCKATVVWLKKIVIIISHRPPYFHLHSLFSCLLQVSSTVLENILSCR